MSTPLTQAPTPKLSVLPTKCANCEKAGLPILPVRYAVLPRMVSARMPEGISGEGVTQIGLTQHDYGLRTLRKGWIYLFYVKGARGNAYWEAYEVTEDGRLWKQSMPLPAVPVTHPACVQNTRALPMDIIAIEQPHKCTEVYIAFSEHKWLDDTFKRYATDSALRKQRMQCIEPAKWIGSAKSAGGHVIQATVKSIDKIVEYMPMVWRIRLSRPMLARKQSRTVAWTSSCLVPGRPCSSGCVWTSWVTLSGRRWFTACAWCGPAYLRPI
jgi:hypothetical protein